MKSELYYSSRKDILPTQSFAAGFAIEAASEFRSQFHCKTKATAKYLKAIKRYKSLANNGVSVEERIAGCGIDATDSISESLHASSTRDLKVGSTI